MGTSERILLFHFLGVKYFLRKDFSMNYEQFEALLSRPRLQRYLEAVQDKEKALLLYAYNIQII